MALSIGSMCSGIGGLDLGLEAAGHRIAWQAERDSWCRGILHRHWPTVTRYHDGIDALSPASLGAVDVIAGGFPSDRGATLRMMLESLVRHAPRTLRVLVEIGHADGALEARDILRRAGWETVRTYVVIYHARSSGAGGIQQYRFVCVAAPYSLGNENAFVIGDPPLRCGCGQIHNFNDPARRGDLVTAEALLGYPPGWSDGCAAAEMLADGCTGQPLCIDATRRLSACIDATPRLMGVLYGRLLDASAAP